MSEQTSLSFEPTRRAGLAHLDVFLPKAGALYARHRNADLGPDRREHVSTLSPYIRHRLITEAEVLSAVLARHKPPACEKFVQEVMWRTYFKGYLEARPTIWKRYLAALGEPSDAIASQAYLRAITGRTGIDCFDAWVSELVETGYLHNHARMWFASIWIFTLRLPWELGADFMLRHLLDGNPASNTLSWRWVGGLHTKGKTYLARRDNIETWTGGRYSPTGLARDAQPLDEPPLPAPAPAPCPPALSALPQGAVGLLLTEEDLGIESLLQGENRVAAIAGCVGSASSAIGPSAERVARFRAGALADTLTRAATFVGEPATTLDGLDPEPVVEWASRKALRIVAAPYAPVGPAADRLVVVGEALNAAGVELAIVRRAYDTTCWPHATRGFFALRERIPSLLERLDLMPDPQPKQLSLFNTLSSERGRDPHA